jgi:hypothetical protein
VSRIASLSAWHPDDPQIPELRDELATLRLIETIGKTVQATTALSPDQRARIVQAIYGNLGNG